MYDYLKIKAFFFKENVFSILITLQRLGNLKKKLWLDNIFFPGGQEDIEEEMCDLFDFRLTYYLNLKGSFLHQTQPCVCHYNDYTNTFPKRSGQILEKTKKTSGIWTRTET